jgi:hypothetical protein
MRLIRNRDHVIFLHTSYGNYQKPQLIHQGAVRLRKFCTEDGIEKTECGDNMHYLRWEHPTTLRACADAGMTYDSTLSYADRPSFRCGTCFEYLTFDPVAQEALGIRIRPLIAMEISVVEKGFMGLEQNSETLFKFIKLNNTCLAVAGCF